MRCGIISITGRALRSGSDCAVSGDAETERAAMLAVINNDFKGFMLRLLALFTAFPKPKVNPLEECGRYADIGVQLKGLG